MATKVIKIEIPIETKDNTGKVVDSISEKMEGLDSAAKKAQKSMENTVNSANKAAKGFESATKSVSGFEKSVGSGFDNASKKASGFEKSVNQTQKSLLAMLKEKYQLLLEAKDQITPTVKQAITYVKSLTSKSWKVTLKAVDLVTSPVRRVFGLLKSPLVAAGVTISAGAGIADTIQTYADFEAAMSEVKAISGATSEEFAQLTEKANQMGAVTKFTASESAEAFKYMAQAGWDAKEMMDGIDGLMALAAASGEDLGTTSDIVTDALTAFGMAAKDSGRFADVMAKAASATNTDVAKMGDTFKYVAPVAGALGYSIEDTAVAIGLMANNGIKASQAGTSLRSLLTNLTHPVGQAEDAVKALEISITNADGSVKPLSQTLQELRSKFSALSEAERAQYAAMLAGQEGMSGLLAIINASDQDFADLTEQINNSTGAAQEMSDIMMDNLSGKFELFTGALDSMKMSLGEKFKPYLVDALEWLTNKVPDIENALLTAMNSFDRFVEKTKSKIDEFTSTDEWKSADLFGKIRISWDELVAEPFSDWWDTKGHDFFVGKAGSLGRGLGTALSGGILTLLGVDTDGILGEGQNIGSAFAKGFADGFDTNVITSKLSEAIKNIFSNAAKILPGGEEADLSSWLSAALIAKIGMPILSTGFGIGKGAFKLGKTLFGSAGAGTGILGFGANTAINLGAGNLAGGASLSAGALSILGIGSAAGGIIGGTTLISGFSDLSEASKAKEIGDEEKNSAYTNSGMWKLSGTATGAAMGAAIGSVIPGIGTLVGGLIGAGVGGIAGWIKGDSAKKEYEENLKAAQEEAEALALAEEQAKYESQELKDALADTSMTAEEFGQLFQKAVGTNLKDHFGDIKLSMQEIQDIAKQMTFGDNIEAVTKFADASEQTEQAYSNMESAISNMDKLNWKASLGLEFDDTDIQEYVNGIDALIQNATDYVESKHYEAKTAIDLLIEPDSDIDLTTGLNTVYAGLQEQIDSLGSQLTAKVNVALEDGVITLDEQAEITNLQNQITEITQKVADIQTEAEFKALKIKYSGAALDADSFAELQAELQEQVESATSSYDEALKVGIASLELQLDEGAISQEQYDEQLQALADGYDAKISDMSVTVENFQLEAIAEAYSEELEGILPELSGTTAEKLQQALHDAMASGADVTAWDTETASQWLGLDSLSMEAQAAITEMMSSVAETIPKSMQEQITSAFSSADMSGAYSGIDFVGPFSNEYYEQMAAADLSGAYVPLVENISVGLPSQIAAIDYSGIGTVVGSGVGSSIQNTDMEPINSAISSLKGNTGTAIDTAFAPGFSTTTPVTITANYKLANPSATISFSGGGSGTATVNGSISSHANGGFTYGPELTWWGEDGPEVIIPLGSKRRQRGLELWAQAGEMLGVGKHADGGFIGSSGSSNKNIWENTESLTEPISESDSGTSDVSTVIESERNSDTKEVNLSVTVNPQFVISSTSQREDDILQIIKMHMKELADDLGGELADRLGEVFSNMPVTVSS